jgi:putative membrane protein
MMWGSGWGGGILGFAMMLLFWGALLALVALAFRWGTDQRRDGRSSGTLDARAILEERFAKGEISADEFEQRRKVLEHIAP